MSDCDKIFNNLKAAKIEQYQPIHLIPEITSEGREYAFRERYRYLKPFCEPLKNKRFLVFGCNLGWNLFQFTFDGANGGVGVDLDKNCIIITNCLAKKYELENKIKFYCNTVDEYISNYKKEIDGEFDYVLMLNIAHHMFMQNRALAWETMKKIADLDKWIILSGYDGEGISPTEMIKSGIFSEYKLIFEGEPTLYNMGRDLFGVKK